MKSIEEAIISIKNFDFKSATQKELEEILPTFGMNDEGLDEMPKMFEQYYGWGVKFWQYPNQFSKLLTFLKDREIDSYYEMGVRWGGTFIIMNEFLLKYNPLLEAHCLDVIPASEILHIYQTKHREHPFWYHQIESNSPFFFMRLEGGDNIVPQKKIDFIFIDACHAYHCVMRDYYQSLMLGPKYILFHDIVNVNTKGTKIAWKEIKKNHKKTYEFTDQYEGMNGKYLGLGLVEISKEDSIFPMFKSYFHHSFDW
jgi:cephalosporin hydroxylase